MGIFLYCGVALDNTLLVALNDLSLEQTKETSNTSKKITRLLNYLATHPEAKLKYHASGIILYVHSDVSYLFVHKARSRAGGIHFLSDPSPHPSTQECVSLINGVVYAVSKILKNMMSSAAEAELEVLFINAK